MKIVFTACLLILTILEASAQTTGSTRPWSASAEVGAGAATLQTPFLLRVNQYATVPVAASSFGTARLNVACNYRTDTTIKSHWHWGGGLCAVFNTQSTRNEIVWVDAFAKVKYRSVELYAGRRREVFGLGDTLLTSGFLIWSGNAPTMPKVQLSTPDFVSIGWLKNVISFKASYAHGWFATPYVLGSYLHQKTLYVRLGKPTWKLKLYAGLNHQVQWGGRADYLLGTQKAVSGLLPQTLKDYFSLVLGRFPAEKRNDRFTEFDGTNRVGNHIGSIDAALEWNGSKANWLIYRQHLYEDASGVSFQNFPDGLVGIRFKNVAKSTKSFSLRSFTMEVLNTMSQSGPVFDETARFQGRDNYFNHGQYIEGWSYLGRTLGSAYLLPRAEVNPALFPATEGIFFPNNRIQMLYAATEFRISRGVIVQLRATRSINYGSYNVQYGPPVKQFSGSAVLDAALPFLGATHFMLAGGYDSNGILANTVGGYVGLKKKW